MFQHIYRLFGNYYHRRYHGRYMHAKKLFVFDLFLLGLSLVALGASLFFFFWKPGLTDWIDLGVSFGGNRVKSGENISLLIDYTNRSKFTLKNVTLAVHLPSGFMIDRTKTPVADFSNDSFFTLADLKPGAKGQKMIYGKIWAEPKKEERIVSILSYTAENSTRPEQKLGSFLLILPESVLASEIKFETATSFPSAGFPLSVSIRNNGAEKIEKINLSISWPGDIVWEQKTSDLALAANESKTIKGTITMPAKAGSYQLKIEPQVAVNNVYVNQGLLSQNISVVSPEMQASASLDTNASYAEPKMVLPLRLFWRNSSSYELKNLRVKLGLTPGIVDVKATTKENNIKLINGELVVDSAQRTLLSSAKPNSSDEVKINLILLPAFNIGEKEKVYLEVRPIIEASVADVSGQIFTTEGSAARILLATEARLSVQARYFTDEGDQLGRGPIPPQAGETTKYWIFVKLGNTTNPLDDPKFSATLAPGVIPTGKQSVTLGDPLRVAGNSLNWSYNQIPANSLTGLYFEVAVTPTVGQIGKNLTLVKSVQFSATDNLTGKKFNLSSTNIDNTLPANDRGALMGAKVQ